MFCCCVKDDICCCAAICVCLNCNKFESSKVNILRIAYSCSVCFLGIILIACSATIFSNIANSIDEFNLLINNWQSEPIYNIEIVQPNTPCDGGYNNEVFHYKWQGTQSGCFCESGYIHTSTCCSSFTKRKDCRSCFGRDIDSLSARHFTNFGVINQNKVQPIKMCIQRIKGLSFAKNYPKQPSCPGINDKACGGQDPKKLTLFCVPNDIPCPITQMLITTQVQNSTTNPNYQSLENKGLLVNTQYTLYVSREGTSTPMVETRVAEGDGVCLKNDENNLSKNHIPYALEDPTRKVCDFTDPRFVPSVENRLDEYNFFMVNNAMDLMTNLLPEFKLSDRFFFQHYYRGYVAFGYECRDKIGKLIKNQNDLDKINSNMIGLLVICCLLGGYFILFEFWFVWAYVESKHDREEYVGAIMALDNNFGSCCTAIIKLILMIIFAIILGITQLSFMDQQKFLDNLLDNDCIDNFTQQMFRNLNDSIDTHLINIILYFWLTYWIFEPNMLFFWLNCCNKTGKMCFYRGNEQNSNKYIDQEMIPADNNNYQAKVPATDDYKPSDNYNNYNNNNQELNYPPPVQNNFNNNNHQPQYYNMGQQPFQQQQPVDYYQQQQQPGFVQQPYQQWPQQQQPYQAQPYQPVQPNNQIYQGNQFNNNNNQFQQPYQQQPYQQYQPKQPDQQNQNLL